MAQGMLLVIFISLTVICFYFLPTLIAINRNNVNKLAIGVLNLLLGWTLIGWVIAIVWAFMKTQQSITKESSEKPNANTTPPPQNKEDV
ncbi:MAG: superinfection immunity protein [Candidatus Omnitrophica bacterium]|nr:superinfection immunity protein [Candidatus Omnitrophota bacterium]